MNVKITQKITKKYEIPESVISYFLSLRDNHSKEDFIYFLKDEYDLEDFLIDENADILTIEDNPDFKTVLNHVRERKKVS